MLAFVGRRPIFLKLPSSAKYGLRFCALRSIEKDKSDTTEISPPNVESRWKRFQRHVVEDKDFYQTSFAIIGSASIFVLLGYSFSRRIGESYERMKDIETKATVAEKDFETQATLMKKDFETSLALSKAELEKAEMKRKFVEDGVESAIFKARLELITGMVGTVAIVLLLFKR